MKVLLVEDNFGDVRLVQEMLSEFGQTRFELTPLTCLVAALTLLQEETFDAALLDLNLSDSYGLETFRRLHQEAPHLPVVVLTCLSDESLGVQAVKAGAQDYLIKGQVDGHLLARSLRYARERHRSQDLLRSLALTDDLTGLYNRRGFMALAAQQLQLAGRGRREFLLISADLDGMKGINDTFGHQEGNRALRETAEVLKQTFRESDLVARLGGDEFAVLMIDAGAESNETFVDRLQANLEAHNASSGGLYKLSLSLGTSRFRPDRPTSLEELLAQADAAMYEQKRENNGNHTSR
jgi:diguanylate cyclase (GGDEF)-like protein